MKILPRVTILEFSDIAHIFSSLFLKNLAVFCTHGADGGAHLIRTEMDY